MSRAPAPLTISEPVWGPLFPIPISTPSVLELTPYSLPRSSTQCCVIPSLISILTFAQEDESNWDSSLAPPLY